MPIPPAPAPNNSITLSALQIVSSALRLIGVIASGESIDISTANDSLTAFNQMLDSWNSDRLAIFTTGFQDFPLVLGKQTYTMGGGGDFDVARPPRIDGMSAMLLDNPANPIEVPIMMYTVEQWQLQMPVKQVDSSFPQVCYDDGGFPLRSLSFWPIPINEINAVRIYSWQPLSVTSTLNTALAFPPGYSEAFRYNLAIRLAAEFATAVPAAVAQIAMESLARVKSMNNPELNLRSDLIPFDGGYNYKADLFGIPF